MVNLKDDVSITHNLQYKYALFVPNGVWLFEELAPGVQPSLKGSSPYYPYNEIVIPVDLITAARLRLIKPGDESGVTDEQWAWLKLLGLTGESK